MGKVGPTTHPCPPLVVAQMGDGLFFVKSGKTYIFFFFKFYLQAYTSLGRQKPELINDPVVVDLAKKHNVSVNLVLLAYALVQGIGILPKSVTPSRIHENIKVVDVKLTIETRTTLCRLGGWSSRSLELFYDAVKKSFFYGVAHVVERLLSSNF
jgi:hypothetical protein